MGKKKVYKSTTTATPEETADALFRARNFHPDSSRPYFAKSMSYTDATSSVMSIPTDFCRNHLPEISEYYEIEDGHGCTHKVFYSHTHHKFQAGWPNFSMSHRLDEGDALLFELIEEKKLKVYIFKAVEGEYAQLLEEHAKERQAWESASQTLQDKLSFAEAEAAKLTGQLGSAEKQISMMDLKHAQLKEEHEKEKQAWESASLVLQEKLNTSEALTSKLDIAEAEAAKLTGQLKSAEKQISMMDLKHAQFEKEREAWESAYQVLQSKLDTSERTSQALKSKLDTSESTSQALKSKLVVSEIKAAEMTNQLHSELSTRDAKFLLLAEISKLASENKNFVDFVRGVSDRSIELMEGYQQSR